MVDHPDNGAADAIQSVALSPRHAFVQVAAAQLRDAAQVDALRRWLRSELPSAGAVLFRGLDIASEAELQRWIVPLTPELLDYDYASTPRTRLQGQVYTSTEYPAHLSIPLHNEMSYCASYPGVLWFCCVEPAAHGGATPIADSREVYRRLSESVRRRFEERGVLYARTYNTGLDLTWQRAFDTEDPKRVEAYCARAGMRFEWRPGGILKTWQVRPAALQHPLTRDWMWFNQAHLFHVTSLEPATRELLLEAVAASDLPRNAYYGDGSEIEPEALDEVRRVYAELLLEFDWQRGDVLAVDNYRVAHGRSPYRGPRRVLVAMAREVAEP